MKTRLKFAGQIISSWLGFFSVENICRDPVVPMENSEHRQLRISSEVYLMGIFFLVAALQMSELEEVI